MTHHPHQPSIPGLDIVDVIAEGGQATLYRAEQPGHDRTVALKVPHGRLLDEASARRFDRERTALGRLSAHPAIVALLDSGYTEDDCPYLVLEYAPGGTLADRLQLGSMSVEEATELAVRLAAALECAHRAGVLHRDLKPHNIVRSTYGQWQLTDFGIAAVTGTGPATSTVQISVAHAAPESFDVGASTVRSDVYSLASTIYTALTGDEPFARAGDEVAMSTIRRAMFEPAPDLTMAEVPDELTHLLRRSLSKDPSERPASALAFGEAVNQIRTDLGLAPTPLVLGITPSTGSGRQLAGPTREAEVSGPFHRVGPGSRTEKRSVEKGGRRLPRWVSSGSVLRRRFVAVAATFAVAALALFAAGGLSPSAPGLIDDLVDSVALAPAAADDGPGLDADGPDGPDGDGPDDDGPDDGGPDGGRDGDGSGPGDGPPEGRRPTPGP